MKARLYQRIISENKLIDCGVMEVQVPPGIDDNNPPTVINVYLTDGRVDKYHLLKTQIGNLYLMEKENDD